MSGLCSLSNKKTLFGHNVSHANNKTNRMFKINAKRVRVYSEVLNMKIPLKLSSHALRTLDKHGGIDEVLKKMKTHKMNAQMLSIKRSIQKKEKAAALQS